MDTTTQPRWNKPPPRFARRGRETARWLGFAPRCTTVMLERWGRAVADLGLAPGAAVESRAPRLKWPGGGKVPKRW